MSNATLPASGPIPAAEALLHTLEREQDGLGRLRDQFGQQLQALRDQQAQQLQRVTLQIGEETSQLQRLQQKRERQTQLLSRALGGGAEGAPLGLEELAGKLFTVPGGHEMSRRLLDARADVVEEAERTQQRREELAFAVEYALKLGREMLHVLQDLNVPPPTRLYTARGAAAERAAPRSFLNKMG